MELKSLFKNKNEKELQILLKSPLYNILNESLSYLRIVFSPKDECKQFHFDCENNSSRNIYQILFRLLTNEQRREVLKNADLRRFTKLHVEFEKDIFLRELKRNLEIFNVEIQSKDKNSYCLYLKSQQDVSCVGSLLHAVQLKNQGMQRFQTFDLDGLKEYANDNQVREVKSYFERNKNKELKFNYGPSLIICCEDTFWQNRKNKK